MKAFKQRGASAVVINDSDVVLNPLELDPSWLEYDLVLQRSLSSSRAISTLQVLEAWGVPTLNNYQTVLTCSDKLRTTLALARAGVPQVEMRISFSQEASQRAIEEIGYPAVLKPLVGSWGRLVAKINDPESAEALLEHRFTLGNYPYHTSAELCRKTTRERHSGCRCWRSPHLCHLSNFIALDYQHRSRWS